MKRAMSVAILLACGVLDNPASAEVGSDLAVQIRFTNRCNASAPTQYIAGEHVSVGMRISGLQTDGEGKLDLIAQAELRDGSGRTILPLPSERFHQEGLALGGGEMNYGRSLVLAADAAGKYVLRFTVKDQVSGKQATDEIPLKVANGSTFGVMNLRTALDKNAEIQTDVFPVGRTMYVVFTANGCAEREGQVHVECEGILTDLAGRRLSDKPIRLTVKPEPSVYGGTGQANIGLYMYLNRSGQFLLNVKIKDAIDGKEAEHVLPILVAGLSPTPVETTASKPSDASR